MENRTLEELNTFAESLDMKIDEISESLSSYTTKTDLNYKSNLIFNQLSKSISTKINQIFTDVSGQYESSEFVNSILQSLTDKVYTKTEIDNKGFLTQHQSLVNYVTKDYLKDTYINKYDIHGLIKCNCVKPDELNATLNNYVTFNSLSSALEKYYTKTEINTKINEVIEKIPSIDNFATKNYVLNTKSTLINYINTNYLSNENADKKYLSIADHTSYTDYVDDTYLKKSDFDALGIIDSDTIKNYVTKDELSNYALSSTVSTLSNNVHTINSKVLKIGQNVTSLASNLKNNYLKITDIYKNYYTKTKIDSLFLTKDDAADTYLTQKKASSSYLTKKEAKYTYLAIEDYKNIKSSISINDTYNNDSSGFNEALKKGSLIDGFYIVNNNVYTVKNDTSYASGSGSATPIDAYTKEEIDNFDYASKTWVTQNCKGHNWIITNDY